MRTHLHSALAAGLVALAFVTPVSAGHHEEGPAHYTLDTTHSKIFFFANHLGFSNSGGEFVAFDGGFHFDENDWSSASVDITIDTASIDLEDEEWNNHMKSEDFFNVGEYPQARFVSERLEKTGDNTGTLYGDLTLLDQTHPVELDVTFNKVGEHPMNGNTVAGFSASTTIDRTLWGISYAVPAVSKEVALRFEIEGIKQ